MKDVGDVTDHAAARRVADAVVLQRSTKEGLPNTTRAFAELVSKAKGIEYQHMHPAKLTFQGLRIHLNQEFDEMRRGMQGAMDSLKLGGRLGVLTWKHTECAILVDFFRGVEPAADDWPLWDWLWSTHRCVLMCIDTIPC